MGFGPGRLCPPSHRGGGNPGRGAPGLPQGAWWPCLSPAPTLPGVRSFRSPTLRPLKTRTLSWCGSRRTCGKWSRKNNSLPDNWWLTSRPRPGSPLFPRHRPAPDGPAPHPAPRRRGPGHVQRRLQPPGAPPLRGLGRKRPRPTSLPDRAPSPPKPSICGYRGASPLASKNFSKPVRIKITLKHREAFSSKVPPLGDYDNL